MVKQGGKLPGSTFIWPANPWTGKVMGPGTSRGTYTYTLKGGSLLRPQRPPLQRQPEAHRRHARLVQVGAQYTQCKQNAYLLQRYIEAYATGNGGTYPAADLVNATTFSSPSYVWPVNPWSGNAMVQDSSVGDFWDVSRRVGPATR